MPQKMTGARLFGQILKSYGVSHLFFMDAVLRRALAAMEDTGINRILGHSEKGVAYMADGYARTSGRPGVCMAQSVGAANLASGMQDPFLGHSPVVAITGRHVGTMQYRNAYQEVDHQPLYTAVTKFHGKIDALEQMQQLMRQAFREATTGTPRPVHLDIAGFTGDALTPMEGDFDLTVDEAHTRFPAFRPAPDPAAVTGSDEDKRHAFALAFDSLSARIERLLALPLDTLSREALHAKLADIGKTTSGGTSS